LRKVTFYLTDEIEEKIRNLAYEKLGKKKGALSIFAELIFREYFKKLESQDAEGKTTD